MELLNRTRTLPHRLIKKIGPGSENKALQQREAFCSASQSQVLSAVKQYVKSSHTQPNVNGTPEPIYLLLWVRAECRETLMRIKYAAKQLHTEGEPLTDK